MARINMIKFNYLTYIPLVFWLMFSSADLKATNRYVLIFDGENLLLTENVDKIDLGKTKKGEVCSATIKIVNRSDKILLIANARGSCGLSIPSWPRSPLAPGDEANIQIRYDSNRTGLINRNISLSANTSHALTIIRVTGEVIDLVK
jgi:hypothetical protein